MQAKNRANRVAAHVGDRINMNDRADAGDNQQHEQAQGVEVQAEFDVERPDLQPVERNVRRAPSGNSASKPTLKRK
jgi:hypothetical protein